MGNHAMSTRQERARGATKHFCLVACWAGGHLGASWGIVGRPGGVLAGDGHRAGAGEGGNQTFLFGCLLGWRAIWAGGPLKSLIRPLECLIRPLEGLIRLLNCLTRPFKGLIRPIKGLMRLKWAVEVQVALERPMEYIVA